MNATRIPNWLGCLMVGWFLGVSVYSVLCAQGTINPPEWTAPVTPIISIVLVAAIWRVLHTPARRRR